jgi:hypothetical protein
MRGRQMLLVAPSSCCLNCGQLKRGIYLCVCFACMCGTLHLFNINCLFFHNTDLCCLSECWADRRRRVNKVARKTVSESTKLCLDASNPIYFAVSIVSTKVLGKYQGKSRQCMNLLKGHKFHTQNTSVIYRQYMSVNTFEKLMFSLVFQLRYY